MIGSTESTLSAAAVLLAFSPPTAAQAVLLETHELTPTDWSEDDSVGWSVSLEGGRALVGAPGAGPAGAGSAYLFDAGSGQQIHILSASDGVWRDDFGWSVSIDGGLALVGAPKDDDAGLQSGSAYVFDASTGLQLFKLTASDAAIGDYFGTSVAIENGLALVGSPDDDDQGPNSGSVYVFDANTGQELRKIIAFDGYPKDHFGHSVALDAGRVLVGAPWDDDGSVNAGSVYLYDANSGVPLLKFTMSSAHAGARFGKSVSLSGDRALVGAPLTGVLGSEVGTAFLFDATSGQELLRFDSPVSENNGHFGWSVDLDGDLMLIGAPQHASSNEGRAYVFDLRNGQAIYQLKAAWDIWFSIDLQLGWSVSIDGSRTLSGGPMGYDNYYYGSAFVHDIPEPGTPFCFGDSGSGIPCPCANENDGSVRGSGCANGVFASGAKLTGVGAASVAQDSLFLTSSHLEPLNAGLYFQGNSALNGGDGFHFGDGLRCAGFGTIRLEVRLADEAGASFTTVGLATAGGVSAGDTKYYQCWYRNPTSPPCGAGVNDFNLTNGYEITWAP